MYGSKKHGGNAVCKWNYIENGKKQEIRSGKTKSFINFYFRRKRFMIF